MACERYPFSTTLVGSDESHSTGSDTEEYEVVDCRASGCDVCGIVLSSALRQTEYPVLSLVAGDDAGWEVEFDRPFVPAVLLTFPSVRDMDIYGKIIRDYARVPVHVWKSSCCRAGKRRPLGSYGSLVVGDDTVIDAQEYAEYGECSVLFLLKPDVGLVGPYTMYDVVDRVRTWLGFEDYGLFQTMLEATCGEQTVELIRQTEVTKWMEARRGLLDYCRESLYVGGVGYYGWRQERT